MAAEGHRVLYDREVPFEIRNQTDPHDSAQEVGVSAARRPWAAGLRIHVRRMRAGVAARRLLQMQCACCGGGAPMTRGGLGVGRWARWRRSR